MATVVVASGGGFLGGAHLAVTPLLGAPAGGATGPALPRHEDLEASNSGAVRKHVLRGWRSGYHLSGKDYLFQRRSPTDL